MMIGGSGPYPVESFGVVGLKPSGSAARESISYLFRSLV
jgi:hypothetical protein